MVGLVTWCVEGADCFEDAESLCVHAVALGILDDLRLDVALVKLVEGQVDADDSAVVKLSVTVGDIPAVKSPVGDKAQPSDTSEGRIVPLDDVVLRGVLVCGGFDDRVGFVGSGHL